MIVEGAGGILVPLAEEDGSCYCVSDLIADFGLPALVVARPGLGTINHTLLTVDHAKRRGIDVACVVISGYPEEPGLAERNNPSTIEAMAGVPLFLLPRADLSGKEPPREIVRCSAMDRIVDTVLASMPGRIRGQKL